MLKKIEKLKTLFQPLLHHHLLHHSSAHPALSSPSSSPSSSAASSHDDSLTTVPDEDDKTAAILPLIGGLNGPKVIEVSFYPSIKIHGNLQPKNSRACGFEFCRSRSTFVDFDRAKIFSFSLIIIM